MLGAESESRPGGLERQRPGLPGTQALRIFKKNRRFWILGLERLRGPGKAGKAPGRPLKGQRRLTA